MKQFRLIIFLLGAIGLCLSSLASADIARTYQVELIIFSHMSQKALDSEQWPLTTSIGGYGNNAVPLASSASDQTYFKLLPPNDFTLASEQARLNQYSSTYHTIAHLAWKQPVFEPRYAKPVHFLAGEINARSGTLPQVNGTIRVSVQHFLEVNLNLWFAANANDLSRLAGNSYFNNTQNGLVYFHLHETRRMRSDELNYIDFPLYGVLIKITPVNS